MFKKLQLLIEASKSSFVFTFGFLATSSSKLDLILIGFVELFSGNFGSDGGNFSAIGRQLHFLPSRAAY